MLVQEISCVMNYIHNIWLNPFYFINIFYNTLILECDTVLQ